VTVPPDVLPASVAAFDLHDPEVPIAEIEYDSLLDLDRSPDLEKSRRAQRQLVFASPTVRIEIRVDQPRTRLGISFTPVCSAEILVLQPGTQVVLATAGPGQAVCQPFRSGLTTVQLVRQPGDGGVVRTAWLLL
jgi:hypothetical protein